MSTQKTLSFGISITTLAIVLMCGCTPQKTSVKSNLSDSYHADIDRIFVVVDTRGLDSETQAIRFQQAEFGLGVPDTLYFSTEFIKELASRFDDIDVEYEFHRNTGDELDEEKCELLAKKFRADEVVWVKEDFIGMFRNNGTWALVPYEEVAELTLDASIRSDADKDVLDWRASIKVVKGSTTHWTHMARTSASTLVDMLVAEVIAAGESSP